MLPLDAQLEQDKVVQPKSYKASKVRRRQADQEVRKHRFLLVAMYLDCGTKVPTSHVQWVPYVTRCGTCGYRRPCVHAGR